MRRTLLACLCWSMLSAARAGDAVALHCARGNVADYPDAQLTLDARGMRVVDVTFVGYRPSTARADWSLRDCLRTAAKYDGSRDIVARLWYREPGLGSPLEPLGPGDDARQLVYRASNGKIAPR